MPSELSSDVKFEIGHVLFIDIVGYSKLLINQQSELLRELNEIVSHTKQFCEADAEGKLIRLPTGDGMALVFRNHLEAPAKCALEISQALKSHPNIRLRMGVHSGPVNEIADVNQRANIAGAGINMAQRVMDCGDAGHILLSKHVAEDLEQYGHWEPYLHDLGECEVKHGVRVSAANLYTNEVGNPEVPEKFRQAKEREQTAPTRSAVWKLAALIVTVAILATGLLVFQLARRKSASPAQVTSAATPSQKSIAVLPLLNESGDPGDEYFSDGLSEELIAALAQIRELKVIGRSSSFRFKDRKEENKTIGEKLGVSTLLEGTVRKQRDHVRIVAELVNAADGSELWSRTFDRELKDIFAVQAEIAKAVAASLELTLLRTDDRPVKNDATQSVEAHNAYLQGHFYFARRNLEDFRKSVVFFDQATRLDPGYALVYAERSEAWTFIADQSSEPQKEAWAAAAKDAEKAVAIDPNLAEAHAALGWVRFFAQWNFAEGEAELRRARQLSPANPTANDLLSRVIIYLGQGQEAEQLARLAAELDPLAFPPRNNLARILLAEGKLDQADAEARKAVELQPSAASGHRWQVVVAIERGDGETALREAQLEPSDGYRRFELALAHYARGDRPAADAALAELIAKDRNFEAYQIAEVYAWRGETDKAFEWLQISLDNHDTGMLSLLIDPLMRGLHQDSRYTRMLEKVGLPKRL